MKIFYQAPVSLTWIKQRPHFIAEGLAQCGNEIFWFYAAPFPCCRFRRIRMGNVSGLELPILPFASKVPFFDWLNRKWIAIWLRHVHADCLIATFPVMWKSLPQRLKALPTAYDCMDIFTEFPNSRIRTAMRRAERDLTASAKCLVASSDAIARHLNESYGCEVEAVRIVPNGISLAAMPDKRPIPGLKHPAVIYTGTIESWLDFKSLAHAAEAHDDWNFYLVGPKRANGQLEKSNVHFIGPVPHSEISRWLATADVLVMPFLRSKLIEGVDPVKMYEYLASGKPIVSSWWPLLEKFRRFPAVSFYGKDGADDFESQILHTLEAGKKAFPPPVDFLAENSWESRVKDFEVVLDALPAAQVGQ